MPQSFGPLQWIVPGGTNNVFVTYPFPFIQTPTTVAAGTTSTIGTMTTEVSGGSGPTTLVLPPDMQQGQPFIVADGNNNAATYPITVQWNGTNEFSNPSAGGGGSSSTSFVINKNGASWTFTLTSSATVYAGVTGT